MKSTHVSLKYRISIRIFLFLTIVIAISVGLRSGYADEASLQLDDASSSSKADAPSLCGPIGFSNNTYLTSNGPTAVEMGDVNGDSKPDLVTANYISNNASVLLGNGNGTFQNATNYPAGDNPVAVAIADLFGDRNDDLVVVNSFTNGVSYLQGAGDGTFFEPYHFVMGPEPYSGVVGDLNNDGWPDLVTVSGSSNKVSIRLNDGVGDFAPATDNNVDGTPYMVTIDDYNGDGKPDLATANGNSDSVSVLLGNGNGTFQAPINFTTGDGPFAVTSGDFNSDGKRDLAATNRLANSVSVLLGNGDGLFQAAVNVGVGLNPLDVAVADFNDDGKPDIAAANKDSNSVSVLLGNGNGTFQAAVNFSAGTQTYSVAVGDFNGDGKPDIATANNGSSNVTVMLNTCVSVPNTPTSTPVPTNTPLPTQTPGGPTATPQACSIQFTDVAADNTFYPFVRCLACRGIISGYACGGPGEPCDPSNNPYFRPSNPVTRGQLAKIVSNSAGFSDPVSGQTFEDVVPGSAFYTFVERLVSREVMGGYACGGAGEPCGSGNLPYFRPGSGATRGQLTKIVSNAAGFTNPAPGTFTFTDVGVGSTFHVYVERLLMNRPGVMGGYDCGGAGEPCDAQNRAYFRPANPLTRGQTSKIVGNAFYPNCQTPGR